MRLTVIGCGHLGATHAACMAEIGHDVLGVDIDQDKVGLLNTGRAWFFEPGLDKLLARHTQNGRLRFTASFEEAASFGTVHFLGVGTPGLPGEDGYDLSQVFGAVAALAPHLTRPALVIGKSTVPPGTTSRLVRELRKLAPAPDAVEVAWNPEFLREGQVADLARTLLGELPGKRIALWGAAFKPGTDDVRDSPGLDVADRLCRLGAEVVVYDPQAAGNALVAFPHLGYADSAAAAAHRTDAVLVVTAWPEFAAIDPAAITAAVRDRRLIDACQAVNPMRWRAAGWTVAAPFPAQDHHSERMRLTPNTTPGSHRG